MNYALDTCVCIGFTFCPDKHYPPSNEFISNTQDELFWTTKVKSEYNRKYSKINRSIIYFLNTLIEISRRKDGTYIDSYYLFERMFLDNTRHVKLDNNKKIKIIEYLWDKLNNVIDFNRIKSTFINVLETFETMKSILADKLNYHHCGDKVHEAYKNLSQTFIDNGGHSPDDIVIIEAHDLGLIQEISLITFDDGLCKACSKTNELSINCILCG